MKEGRGGAGKEISDRGELVCPEERFTGRRMPYPVPKKVLPVLECLNLVPAKVLPVEEFGKVF